MELKTMGTTEKDELREILKLLELENIHISEENCRATYVGKLRCIKIYVFFFI